MMSKTCGQFSADRASHAVIIGAHGQDGRILSPLLSSEGVSVVKIGRGEVVPGSSADIRQFMPRDQACEIYHLAAVHGPAEAKPQECLEREICDSFETHATLTGSILEVMRQRRLGDRLFFASSSRIFGSPAETPQTESTPRNPTCVYGISKMAGMQLCRRYREAYGVHASSGILFNHESEYRRHGFVSRKIVEGAIRAVKNRDTRLMLGSLDDQVDWSSASDVVRAMTAIVRCDQPRDYIVASGEAHTVRDFVAIAYDEVGLRWQDHVRLDPSLITTRRATLVGDASLLRRETGWKSTVAFEDLVRGLVRSAIQNELR